MSIRQRTALFMVVLLAAAAFPAAAAKRVINGKIAFVSDRDGNLEIYVMNPDGSGQTRLTNTPAGELDPAWSPDGRRIAFVRNGQLFVMNADGSGQTPLPFQSFNGAPAWSPDGKQIAFQSRVDGGSRLTICIMGADGSNPRAVTSNPRGDDYRPTWSPDGRSLAFTRFTFGFFNKWSIAIVDADGTNLQTLVESDAPHYSPWFSPDGRAIVFAKGTAFGERERITVMNADGSNQTGLTRGAGNVFSVPEPARPVFSPDGKKIAFAAQERSESDQSIHIIDADGSNEVQITDNKGVNDNRPSWQRAFPAETTGVYVPSTGHWLLRNSNTTGGADFDVPFGGQPSDLPVAGDWDGDGRTDIAVFRDGKFVRARLVTSLPCVPCQLLPSADPLDTVSFGQAGDLPVAGDWNGDGKDDLGVFRPGIIGQFLLRVPQIVQVQGCPLCPPHIIITTKTVPFGSAGHLPVAGDWDGDGKDDVGVFDPATANFFLTDDLAKPNFIFPFGLPGDRPLAGDWLGVARDGVGVFQPPTTTMSLASQLTAPPDFVFTFGTLEGLPVAGHWTPAQ